MKKSIISASQGFSLLELIMVATLIGLLVGIARPFLLQSTIAANEKASVATIRIIGQGQIHYIAQSPEYGTLEQLVDRQIVDQSLQDGRKSGYQFSTQNLSNTHFEVIAVPIVVERTGQKGFFVDETAVIRYSEDGLPPDSSSPPLRN